LVNVGEQDEPRLIENLVSLRGKRIEPLGDIASVASYDGVEYPARVQRSQILKAPTSAKRDVIINGRGYSTKSTRGARVAIVNHTTREKWLRVCKSVGLSINPLDEMVSEYWRLRVDRRIGEDVPSSSMYCPFGNNMQRKEYLRGLVNYFLFDGSGARDSRYPAEYILEFADPLIPSTWKVLDKRSAFDSMWPKMVFSIRSEKGMPSKYPNISACKKALIEPWVRHIDGEFRGSLHIRTR
jgi:hypothetical protein